MEKGKNIKMYGVVIIIGRKSCLRLDTLSTSIPSFDIKEISTHYETSVIYIACLFCSVFPK